MPDAWLIPGIVLASIQFVAYLVTRNLRKRSEQTPVKKNIPLEVIEQNTKCENCNEKNASENQGSELPNTKLLSPE